MWPYYNLQNPSVQKCSLPGIIALHASHERLINDENKSKKMSFGTNLSNIRPMLDGSWLRQLEQWGRVTLIHIMHLFQLDKRHDDTSGLHNREAAVVISREDINSTVWIEVLDICTGAVWKGNEKAQPRQKNDLNKSRIFGLTRYVATKPPPTTHRWQPAGVDQWRSRLSDLSVFRNHSQPSSPRPQMANVLPSHHLLDVSSFMNPHSLAGVIILSSPPSHNLLQR